jgi:hypothetical protein
MNEAPQITSKTYMIMVTASIADLISDGEIFTLTQPI